MGASIWSRYVATSRARRDGELIVQSLYKLPNINKPETKFKFFLGSGTFERSLGTFPPNVC